MKPGNLQDQSVKVPIPTDSKRIWKIRGGAWILSPLLTRRGLFFIPSFLPRSPVDLQEEAIGYKTDKRRLKDVSDKCGDTGFWNGWSRGL